LDDFLKDHFALFFPFFFCALWLLITAILATISGWFALQTRFPVRSAQVLRKLHFQSAAMGKGAGTPRTNFNGVLTISICAEGLKIDIMRIFGPFCRAFFVPWEDITSTERKTFFGNVTELRFGTPAIATVTVRRRLAELLRAAGRDGGIDKSGTKRD
jgi:hypothetical protein